MRSDEENLATMSDVNIGGYWKYTTEILLGANFVPFEEISLTQLPDLW
jgi:hypothetical protein